MFMYSHVQLCAVMHVDRGVGCMVMDAQVCSCIVTYSCV